MGKLVAYSGFSATNYLEMPYNPDLDFGTGDFCVMGWVKTTDNFGCLFNRGTVGATADLIIDVSLGKLRILDAGSVSLESASGYDNGAWHFIAAYRSGSTLNLGVNGQIIGSTSNSTDFDNIGAVSRFGLRTDGTSGLNGSLALLRISATAPTAEQIAKIYNDEKVLFQENAQATLYGASDAVTALAHDPDTDLLHVGTSAGRSIFEGLRRVGNTTTSVSATISASGGLIVEK